MLSDIYHSPNGDTKVFLEFLDEILNDSAFCPKGLIVLGEFNISYLIESPNAKKLKVIVNDVSFKQLILQSTRCTLNSSSLIDLAIPYIPHMHTVEFDDRIADRVIIAAYIESSGNVNPWIRKIGMRMSNINMRLIEDG